MRRMQKVGGILKRRYWGIAPLKSAEHNNTIAAEDIPDYLTNPDPAVRRRAVGAAIGLDLQHAVPLLLPLLADPDIGVCWTVFEALSRTGATEQMVTFLLKHVTNVAPDMDTLAFMLDALGRLGDTRALQVVTPLLAAAQPDLRYAAAESVLRIDPTVGVELGIPLLNDPEAYVRQHVAGLLHDHGDRRAVSALVRALYDCDGSVRLTVCFALGKVGDETTLPVLYWVEQHDDGEDVQGYSVRGAASAAITTIIQRQHEH